LSLLKVIRYSHSAHVVIETASHSERPFTAAAAAAAMRAVWADADMLMLTSGSYVSSAPLSLI
jgi:hypothetical protein